MKKFIAGTVIGIMLSVCGNTLLAQREREFHPRLMRAIEQMRDARAYLLEAPHDFGGHKEAAIRAIDVAIVQTVEASKYRDRR